MLENPADYIDVYLAILLALFGAFFALRSLIQGGSTRTTCNAPTQRGGACRNKYRGPRPCRSGHSPNWPTTYLVTAAGLMVVAVALAVARPIVTFLT